MAKLPRKTHDFLKRVEPRQLKPLPSGSFAHVWEKKPVQVGQDDDGNPIIEIRKVKVDPAFDVNKPPAEFAGLEHGVDFEHYTTPAGMPWAWRMPTAGREKAAKAKKP